MWYVYILVSEKDSGTYVGSTDDLERRMEEHRQGHCKSTAHRRPLTLNAYVAVSAETTARNLEKYFKTGSGIAILKKRILTSEARRA